MWAGVLPLAVTAAAPLTSPLTDPGVTPSAAVTRRARGLGHDLGPEDVDR